MQQFEDPILYVTQYWLNLDRETYSVLIACFLEILFIFFSNKKAGKKHCIITSHSVLSGVRKLLLQTIKVI